MAPMTQRGYPFSCMFIEARGIIEGLFLKKGLGVDHLPPKVAFVPMGWRVSFIR